MTITLITGANKGQAETAHNEPGLANHQAFWEVVPGVALTAINLTTAAGCNFFTSTRRITGGYQFFVETWPPAVHRHSTS
jgi:hypothetical protein